MRRQQRYTAEFKAEAVKRVWEAGWSLEQAAQRLGIPKGTPFAPWQCGCSCVCPEISADRLKPFKMGVSVIARTGHNAQIRSTWTPHTDA